MATTKAKEGMVKIKLPRPVKGEDSHMFVGCHGKTYLIEKGVEVEVPEAVAEILENCEKQKDELYKSMIEKVNE